MYARNYRNFYALCINMVLQCKMQLHRRKRHSQYQHSKHAQPRLICSSNHTIEITIFIGIHSIEIYKYIQQKPKSSHSQYNVVTFPKIGSLHNKNIILGSMPEKRRVITLGEKIVNIRSTWNEQQIFNRCISICHLPT